MSLTHSPQQAAAVLPLFRDIPEREKDELLKAGRLRTLKKGEKLFRRGDALNTLYILVEGALRQYRETPDGKEVTLGMVLQGDMADGAQAFEQFDSYQWSTIAAEDSILLEYPAFWFREKVKSHNQLALNLIVAMSKQANITAIAAEQRITFSAAQRVACFLLRTCAIHSFNPKDFELPYSKGTIASALGMELETFSRTLQKLRDVGVAVQKARVTIKDVHALECFICDHCSLAGECETITTLEKSCPSGNVAFTKPA